jgi:hypothetical protein
MRRGLFAYVHPRSDVPEEEREALLEQLRRVYTLAVEESERVTQRQHGSTEYPKLTVRKSRPYDDIASKIEPDAPPMQVIFGVDRLVTLVDSLLEPSEKLGKVALSTQKSGVRERERLRTIAQNMAEQMGCFVETQDEAEGYTVWLYGPRNRIDVLVHALNMPSA